MSFRPKRASVDATSPRAWATCGRCGFITNREKMVWQQQWRGPRLMNTGLLVCQPCFDVPAEFLRTITIPPDPPPVRDPRVEPYEIDETNWRATQDDSIRQTEADDLRVTEDG